MVRLPKGPLAKREIRLAHITSLHVHTVDGRNPSPLLITRDFLYHWSYSSPGKGSSCEWLRSCSMSTQLLILRGWQGETSNTPSCMTWQAVQDFSHPPYDKCTHARCVDTYVIHTLYLSHFCGCQCVSMPNSLGDMLLLVAWWSERGR